MFVNLRKANVCTFISEMTSVRTSSWTKPEVTVSPRGHLLVDDELHIRVQGLERRQEVTIHTGIDVSGRTMESCCQFRANDFGVVDLYSHPSLAGSYTEVSPMGIFWSMVPTPDMPKGFRLMVKNVSKPIKTDVSVYPGNHTKEGIRFRQPTPIATHVIERWYRGQGVSRVKVTHGRLRGTLFLPLGPGPFPGVIDLFGAGAGLMEYRSALLASRGIASLALAYCMYEDLPEKLHDVDLDYFLEAVQWLLGHPNVYGEAVGIVGVSKGANIGFSIAANCPKVRAFVNINGCTVHTDFPMKFSGGDIPCVMRDMGKMRKIGEGWSWREALEYDEADLRPVWRHNPKVLNIVSEDDLCLNNDCIHLMKKHYPVDKRDNFTILSYPGAGHLLEPPYAPLCTMSYYRSMGYMMWGGQPKPHADAQEDAWRHILKFLHTHIPKTNITCAKL